MGSKRKFYSMIEDKNVIKKFKSRGSYRIVVGTIYDEDCGTRVVIEAFYRKSGQENFEVLFTPETNQCSYSGYLIDFSDILRKILNKANKVTRRWFLREARNLVFFESKLEDFLKPNSSILDWDKIEKNYLERKKRYDNI